MLLVIRAQATIIGTTIMCFRVECIGHLRRLVIVSDVFVILHIVGDQHFRIAMLRAALEHKDFVVIENDFGVDSLQAYRAKTQREIVVSVFSSGHT